MGFLGLIPASHLAASYNVRTHKLTLYASGEVQDYTSGIAFHRLPLMGGLEFALEGWTGPLTDKKSKYTHSQDFDMPLPNPATPSGTVILVDANDPRGKVLPIRFLGGVVPPHIESAEKEKEKDNGVGVDGGEKSAVTSATAVAVAVEEKQTVMVAAPQQQVVLDILNHPFTIHEAAEVPKLGSVHVKFDSKFVRLENAGVENMDVVWTFVGKKVGRTQVVVTVAGGVAMFLMVKVHDVRIVRLGEGEEEGEDKGDGNGA